MIARAPELGAIERFVAASAERPSVLVLEGEPGIGKTTLWSAAVGAARKRGLQVLAANPSDAEAQLSFAALTDLLEDVDADAFGALPAPQRTALDVALLRAAAPDDGPPEPRAISFALLNVLRTLAGRGALVVAVDDIQWLDSASADALAFAARRLDGEPVSFLLARRPGEPSDVERVLERSRPTRLQVGPLGLTATGRLLRDRLGLNVRRPQLRKIVAATGGNPLFALELGQTLAEQGPPRTGDDMPVPELVEDLLGTRVACLPDPLRRLLLAVALSDVRASQLNAIAEPDVVDEAVASGLLVVERDHVRASHPLLAAAARQRSTAAERRALHAELARVAADDELRAFHLALATEDPDDELAATVEAAAAAAAARGAAQEAVVLAEHALRLTADPEEQTRRLLALAEYLNVAGELVRLTDLLAPRLDSLPPGEARVKACLLLSDGAVEGTDDVVRYLDRALTESARDVRLRAIVLADIAANEVLARVEQVRKAEERALEAVETGRDAGPDVERTALYALAWARSLRGRAIEDICERFHELSDGPAYVLVSPDRVASQRLVWRGEIVAARETLARRLAVADERGETIAYAIQRLHLCELELRAGRWDAATRLLDEWERDGELLTWACYERCRALLAAGRGSPDETQRWAREAIERAQRVGVYWDALEALRARGIGALLAGDLALAEGSLRTVWEHTQREGVDEPGAFPVAPDLVEALVGLERLDEAQAVIDRLRDLSEERDHPWGLATTRRCAALVQLASGSDGEEAMTELTAAANVYGALGLRFDRARSLLALGRAQRRLRKWAAARSSLEQAAEEFDELGSPGWAEQARSEGARLGGRRPGATDELTTTERRVAELAADGLSNKEIARSLHVTVRTIEVHLKHAYAKLGIRSRTQVARRLSQRV